MRTQNEVLSNVLYYYYIMIITILIIFSVLHLLLLFLISIIDRANVNVNAFGRQQLTFKHFKKARLKITHKTKFYIINHFLNESL